MLNQQKYKQSNDLGVIGAAILALDTIEVKTSI